METKNFLSILIAICLGFSLSAQNPFSNMLGNPPNYDIIDQDVQSRTLVHAGNSEITGSLGIGIDITTPFAYGFDTFVLMENNLRIFFNDTSNSASFPNNDWGITINDSANGGSNYFGVADRTAGTIPFRVEAGAGNNALFVEAGGNVGFGNSNPALELHVTDGDTPTLRLEQDGSNGFTPQTWDVAGNETNFFIRDVTNSSRLPFRIRPGALTSSIDIGADGTVAINGTASNPNVSIDLVAGDRGMLLNRMTNAERTTFEGGLTGTEEGIVVYDTEDDTVYTWDGVAWIAGGTDDQVADVFQLTGNDLELSLEDDGVANNIVDLSGYLDNTDDQIADVFQLTGNDLELSLEDDGAANNIVDLSGYLDNTDDQIADVFQLTGNNLELSLEDDGAANSVVDLSGYLDNTDDQQLSLDIINNILMLEDGGSVDLTSFKKDDQILTDFSISGTVLKIEIEDGNFLEVDIASILTDLENQVTALELQMIDVLERLDIIEECACDGTLGGGPDLNVEPDRALLFQNIPNPFDNTTNIGYFVPFTYSTANIVISTTTGKILNNIPLTKLGEGSIIVNKATMQAAMYFYTLFVDGKKVDTKRMIVN